MSHPSLTDLRQLLTTHRPGRSCDGYPDHVRATVVASASSFWKAGWTRTALARELGIAATTLTLWLGEPATPSFRPVTVVSRPPPPTPTLALVTPGGYRIEGLDIDAAAALLARLS